VPPQALLINRMMVDTGRRGPPMAPTSPLPNRTYRRDEKFQRHYGRSRRFRRRHGQQFRAKRICSGSEAD